MRRATQRAVAKTAWREGHSLAEIARLTGVPKSTVYEWVGGIERTITRTCPCGVSFVADHPLQRYCSRAHQIKLKSFHLRKEETSERDKTHAS